VDAVVLTFPGHLFQTLLCLRSLDCHFPEINTKYVVYDDLSMDHWPSYRRDLQLALEQNCLAVKNLVPFSALSGIERCQVGWWRQQLIKLCIDRLLPGSIWFVVDGDVIFEQHIDVYQMVPVSLRSQPSNTTELAFNYVSRLLGVQWNGFRHKDQFALTNPIPFRYLEKTMLQALRKHVEARFRKEFLHLHCDWFLDQTIVAYADPPVQMGMSEWELIEAFQQLVMENPRSTMDIGSGYSLEIESRQLATAVNVFRHGYVRDTQIPQQFYQNRGIQIDNQIWNKALAWTQHQHRDPYV